MTAELRKAIPWAEEAKVVLTPENVWNKFLVSPIEMRTFVDQFHSPWLQTHFDVGNVMQYGYPQDWILTLGPRIKRVHLKDYKLSNRDEQGHFADLLEGDVDWKAVMAALVKAGYRVSTASNGADARLIIERDPAAVHVLFTDVVMPGMSGQEVVEELRSRRLADALDLRHFGPSLCRTLPRPRSAGSTSRSSSQSTGLPRKLE